ncbi:MAG: hypothetical protein IKH51_03300 [Clostridia bacterium]|nr:hypothetical protein [Clostridia bacterium]
MAKYKVNLIFEDGSEEEQDEIFDTYEEAEDHAQYLCDCYYVGVDTLNMSNPDENPETSDDVNVDYEIIEID